MKSFDLGERCEKRNVRSSDEWEKTMTEIELIQERLDKLEQEFEALKQRIEKPKTMNEWLERVSGRFKDDPDFEEIVRLGREWRQSQREP